MASGALTQPRSRASSRGAYATPLACKLSGRLRNPARVQALGALTQPRSPKIVTSLHAEEIRKRYRTRDDG
jgi:hypothetical protein